MTSASNFTVHVRPKQPNSYLSGVPRGLRIKTISRNVEDAVIPTGETTVMHESEGAPSVRLKSLRVYGHGDSIRGFSSAIPGRDFSTRRNTSKIEDSLLLTLPHYSGLYTRRDQQNAPHANFSPSVAASRGRAVRAGHALHALLWFVHARFMLRRISFKTVSVQRLFANRREPRVSVFGTSSIQRCAIVSLVSPERTVPMMADHLARVPSESVCA